MNNRNIVVSFPLDRRTDYSRNDMLDGKNHEIKVAKIETFTIENQIFYMVSGFDITRGCGIEILLIKEGNILRKVPLLDYDELNHYEINPRTLSEQEVQSLLNGNSPPIPPMPLTTIANIIKQKNNHKFKLNQIINMWNKNK